MTKNTDLEFLSDAEKDRLLSEATEILQHAGMKSGETERAMHLLERIPGWKDADALLKTCRDRIAQTERIEQEERETIHREMREERKQKKRRKAEWIFFGVAAVVIVTVAVLKLSGVI